MFRIDTRTDYRSVKMSRVKQTACYIVQAFAILLVALLALTGAQPILAQESGWAPVQSIPGYERDNLPPHMVADLNNTVHAFTSNNFGDLYDPDRVVIYSNWQRERGWSYPTDILASPIRNQARVQGAFLDNQGYIHLLFFGGDDKGAEIFYSKAPALEAGNSQSWTKPLSIGQNAIAPDFAAFVGDDFGTLVAVYSGDVDRIGLYEVHSTDFGETWSEPEEIFLTFSNSWQPSDLNMHMGQSGRVHVVWNVTNERGDNVSGYYTNADVGLWSWQEPMELDEQRGLGIAIPNVIEHQNAVWIIYNNGIGDQVAPVQWTRVSYDGGLRWSNPVRPFVDHIGRNGNIAFAKDSGDQLHVMFGQRYYREGENQPTHGLWYSKRINENWASLTSVVEGRSELDEAAEVGFDPYDARAVVSQGNYLLVTWRTDPGLSRDGVWYSYRRLNAPALPVEPLPVVASVAEPQTSSTATTIEVPTSASSGSDDGSDDGSDGGPADGPADTSADSGESGSADINTEESAATESDEPAASEPAPTRMAFGDLQPPKNGESSPASALVSGIIPALIFIGGMVGIVRYFKRRRTWS